MKKKSKKRKKKKVREEGYPKYHPLTPVRQPPPGYRWGPQ